MLRTLSNYVNSVLIIQMLERRCALREVGLVKPDCIYLYPGRNLRTVCMEEFMFYICKVQQKLENGLVLDVPLGSRYRNSKSAKELLDMFDVLATRVNQTQWKRSGKQCMSRILTDLLSVHSSL